MSEPVEIRPLSRAEQRAAIRRLRETRRYAPTLAEGTTVDENGWPVVADDPDDEPDERY